MYEISFLLQQCLEPRIAIKKINNKAEKRSIYSMYK